MTRQPCPDEVRFLAELQRFQNGVLLREMTRNLMTAIDEVTDKMEESGFQDHPYYRALWTAWASAHNFILLSENVIRRARRPPQYETDAFSEAALVVVNATTCTLWQLTASMHRCLYIKACLTQPLGQKGPFAQSLEFPREKNEVAAHLRACLSKSILSKKLDLRGDLHCDVNENEKLANLGCDLFNFEVLDRLSLAT
eukprot:s1584_g10.t1